MDVLTNFIVVISQYTVYEIITLCTYAYTKSCVSYISIKLEGEKKEQIHSQK